jgi:hypothetical protein
MDLSQSPLLPTETWLRAGDQRGHAGRELGETFEELEPRAPADR